MILGSKPDNTQPSANITQIKNNIKMQISQISDDVIL